MEVIVLRWQREEAGVCGIGIAAASSCRESKSARLRPKGRMGGQRRWRFGVEGKAISRSVVGVEGWSFSESDRRRFRDGGGGVGCDGALVGT